MASYRSVIAGFVVLLSALSVSIADAGATRLRGLSVQADTADWRGEILTAVNLERAKAGLPALCLSSSMSHTGSEGSTPQARIDAEGFQWSAIAENIAEGQISVSDVMSSWMNSPGHRANILGNYKFFGAGMTNDDYSSQRFWTQVFASSDSEPCACKA
ncbi:hypothetical protein P43SY_003956 [Pythium insidiosum]|uniref:SCP domain-containing protein n=1 Tax=Pythium insidiosum TaxID=114742 RepID=A0AAD5LXW0_PYTIN|nr:hypothetical protein P43SY_003956 [Pythium insidiosum]